jgi:hypothetical protein
MTEPILKQKRRDMVCAPFSRGTEGRIFNFGSEDRGKVKLDRLREILIKKGKLTINGYVPKQSFIDRIRRKIEVALRICP